MSPMCAVQERRDVISPARSEQPSRRLDRCGLTCDLGEFEFSSPFAYPRPESSDIESDNNQKRDERHPDERRVVERLRSRAPSGCRWFRLARRELRRGSTEPDRSGHHCPTPMLQLRRQVPPNAPSTARQSDNPRRVSIDPYRRSAPGQMSRVLRSFSSSSPVGIHTFAGSSS